MHGPHFTIRFQSNYPNMDKFVSLLRKVSTPAGPRQRIGRWLHVRRLENRGVDPEEMAERMFSFSLARNIAIRPTDRGPFRSTVNAARLSGSRATCSRLHCGEPFGTTLTGENCGRGRCPCSNLAAGIPDLQWGQTRLIHRARREHDGSSEPFEASTNRRSVYKRLADHLSSPVPLNIGALPCELSLLVFFFRQGARDRVSEQRTSVAAIHP